MDRINGGCYSCLVIHLDLSFQVLEVGTDLDRKQNEDMNMYQSFQFLNIQWGSEYSKHLNTGLVWYSNGKFVSGCQTVPYSNGGRKTELKKPVTIPKHGITVRAQIVNI